MQKADRITCPLNSSCLSGELLNDDELVADEGDCELLILCSCYDTHDSEYKNCDRSDPSDYGDDSAYNAADRKNDAVVNVILYIRVVLLGLCKKSDEPKGADVAQDSVELAIAGRRRRIVIDNGSLVVNVLIFHFPMYLQDNIDNINNTAEVLQINLKK